MTTKLVTCGCKGGAAAEFQDKKYGQGVRIANKTDKKVGEKNQYRCTVCGKLH